MEWIIWIALIFVVLAFVLSRIPQQAGGEQEFSYEKIEPLFSPAERSFFGVLTQAVNERAVVLGKVRVADVLRPTKGVGKSQWQKAFNRISAKHFDYVICAPDTLVVLAVVELDDKSHAKRNRVERDILLDSACADAGLPLHRFKVAASYSIAEVRQVLFPTSVDVAPPSSLAGVTADQSSQEHSIHEPSIQSLATTTEMCPKCTAPLVKKVAKKGEHKGSAFMACSAFPKCRHIVKV